MKDIVDIIQPYKADILSMSNPAVIADPPKAIQDAFVHSIKSPGLKEIIQKEYDIVITHGGFVGINHYQTSKAAVVSIPVVKKDGTLILLADNTDSDPVGSTKYRTCLHLLKLFGTEKFKKLLQSPDWQFVPDQWQVQMWMKVFEKIAIENFVYYAPQVSQEDYAWIPGTDGNTFLPKEKQYKEEKGNSVHIIQNIVRGRSRQTSSKINIAFLADGPYGIPVSQNVI